MTAFAQQVLASVNPLPALSPVVGEVLSALDDPAAGALQAARIVERDPVLAAKVLRLANSAFYRRQREIGTIEDAVLVIGAGALRMLVLGSGVCAVLEPLEGLDAESVWRHAAIAAVATRMLGRRASANGNRMIDPERAHAAALIQCVGDLPLRRAHPDAMREIDQDAPWCDRSRAALQLEVLGGCYPEVTAALAEQWHFPSYLCDTFAGLSPRGQPSAASTLVQLALAVATAHCTQTPIDVDAGALLPLRLTASDVFETLENPSLVAAASPLAEALLH